MGGDRVDQLLKYRRTVRKFTAILLLAWAFVSLGCAILFVVPMNNLNLSGVPLGFWMAQQGSIFIFVVLIFVYAWRMDKHDHNYHADE